MDRATGKKIGCSLVIALWTTAGWAHEPKAPSTPPASATSAAETGTPAAAVESFHAALASSDRAAALSWLDPQAVVFESGGAEMSREEYASHHLESDMAFVGATRTEVVDRQSRSEGDTGWVLSRTRTTGEFRGQAVDVNGVETMVLRRSNGVWRVVHIHWSSHPRSQP